MTTLIDYFFGLFHKCSESCRNIEVSAIKHTPWNSLPKELLEQILNLIRDPARTALVNRNFNKQSQYSYTLLLGQYEDNPCLTPLIPRGMQPAQKVKVVYLSIIREARSCGIEPTVIEPKLLPLAPKRLEKIRNLTIPRLQDKLHLYRAIFYQLNPQFFQTFNQMTMLSVIETSERNFKFHGEIYSARPNKLDLGYCRLTHLPPLIGQLKALNNLNLHDNELATLPIEMKSLTKLQTLHLNGNPLLSKQNVKEVCQSLPRLKTVFIDNEQPDLIEMFQTHLPNLQLRVVHILRLDEEI
jgi:hypothetical protein